MRSRSTACPGRLVLLGTPALPAARNLVGAVRGRAHPLAVRNQPKVAGAIVSAIVRPALVLHLSSALAALVLGVLIMARAKGTASHRMLGRTWVALMSIAALSSFWLTGLSDGLSVIHVLSVWTL